MTTHMIVVCDQFSYEDYPVYVLESQDVREKEQKCNKASMQRVMEIYSYSMAINEQLNETRSFNY